MSSSGERTEQVERFSAMSGRGDGSARAGGHVEVATFIAEASSVTQGSRRPTDIRVRDTSVLPTSLDDPYVTYEGCAIDLGYAITSYRSQSKTVDDVLVLVSPMIDAETMSTLRGARYRNDRIRQRPDPLNVALTFNTKLHTW
jgi:hypothetical protein